MKGDKEYLHLKFGAFKGGYFPNNKAANAALKEWQDANTKEAERAATCKLIDAINGPISIWWIDEENVSKERAKEYVIQYGKKD